MFQLEGSQAEEILSYSEEEHPFWALLAFN